MLAKTGKAREALEAGKAGAVELRDRRILILADGRRTRAELVALLGPASASSIDRLVRDGYLAGEPVVSITMPAPAKRRSLAAAKMYLVDMLQLQRNPVAVELRLAIQSTTDPAQLLDRLFDALDHLVASTTASYGERVRERFAEVVPDEALARLRELQSARSSAGAFQSPLTTASSGQ